MLGLLNVARARSHLPSLTLSAVQSRGNATCKGSYGHSWAMAQSGRIWHTNTHFPRASFPNNICDGASSAAENVGVAASGSVANDLSDLEALMIQEPHSTSYCAKQDDHACNILNPAFRSVGIGIYIRNGATWVTEDFSAVRGS